VTSPLLLLLTVRGVEIPNRVDIAPLSLGELEALVDAARGGSAGADGSRSAQEVDNLIADLGRRVALHGQESLVPVVPHRLPALVDPPRRRTPQTDASAELVTYLPRSIAVTAHGFVLGGAEASMLAPLSAAALKAYHEFRAPIRPAEALAAHQAAAGNLALSAQGHAALVADLIAAGVLDQTAPGADRGIEGGRHAVTRETSFAQRKAIVAAGNDLVRQPALPGRRSVIALYDEAMPVNLALGMLLAFAETFDGGRLREHYEMLPVWVSSPKALRRRLERDGPTIFLFSNYVWSVDRNLAMARQLKEASPGSVMIHGGPSTPKYDADSDAFFAANIGVDIAVRGEGEHTFVAILDALLGSMGGESPDLSVLATVEGLSYRVADGNHRTPDRARMAELDVVPSPYLNGMFDRMVDGGTEYVSIETNRGCPYGCTFCDWGSATNSRIRKFDLQRVFDEIEWASRSGVENLFIVDANFGIFSRDVDIARKVVECHEQYGFPKSFSSCFAKNTIKYTAEICTLLWNAGITFHPVVALQTTDDAVLAAVDRSNIKTEAYDNLADHLRDLGATVGTELIMGLPGSSLATFANDLQGCIDRELFATVYETVVLPNSPMNDPAYRATHQIETVESHKIPGQTRMLVAAAATFTRADRDVMQRRRRVFRLFEDIGLLRHVARWVRHTTGLREIDFYIGLSDLVHDAPHRYPLVAWVLHDTQFTIAPLSWRHFLDEVVAYLVDELGIEDPRNERPGHEDGGPGPSSALRTVLQVQLLLIADEHRTFPAVAHLEHDYASWYLQIRQARRRGEPWWHTVAPLHEFGPATFDVTGSEWLNGMIYGTDMLTDFSFFCELESPVMRGSRRADAGSPDAAGTAMVGIV